MRGNGLRGTMAQKKKTSVPGATAYSGNLAADFSIFFTRHATAKEKR
jgi:hypothetical protein